MPKPYYVRSYRENGLEKTLRFALEKRGEVFIAQYPIGKYRIDFYLPHRNLCIEADGRGWHKTYQEVIKSQGTPGHDWIKRRYLRDLSRNRVLRSAGYNLVRLREDDIRKDPHATLSDALANFPLM